MERAVLVAQQVRAGEAAPERYLTGAVKGSTKVPVNANRAQGLSPHPAAAVASVAIHWPFNTLASFPSPFFFNKTHWVRVATCI